MKFTYPYEIKITSKQELEDFYMNMCIDWSQIDKNEYFAAMKESHLRDDKIKNLLKSALTNRINDRELFMKGIDTSYYYEEIE